MTILVIDGQGGKLGRSLVENIKKSFPHVEVMAVGTNSAASDAMRRARVLTAWLRAKTPSSWPAAARRLSPVLSASPLPMR